MEKTRRSIEVTIVQAESRKTYDIGEIWSFFARHEYLNFDTNILYMYTLRSNISSYQNGDEYFVPYLRYRF